MIKRSPATAALVIVCLTVYGVQAASAHDLVTTISARQGVPVVSTRLGMLHPAVLHWQLYRLLTGAFLHVGLVHLAVNVTGLGLGGRVLEPRLGSRRFLALFLGATVLGDAAATFTIPDNTVVVGASAGVIGLFGAITTHALLAGADRELRLAVLPMVAVLVTGIAHGYMSNPGHVAGLGAGVLAGLVLQPRRTSARPDDIRVIDAGGGHGLRLTPEGLEVLGVQPPCRLAWGQVGGFHLGYVDGREAVWWRGRPPGREAASLPLDPRLDPRAVLRDLEAWRVLWSPAPGRRQPAARTSEAHG